jgi:hypothetical protein
MTKTGVKQIPKGSKEYMDKSKRQHKIAELPVCSLCALLLFSFIYFFFSFYQFFCFYFYDIFSRLEAHKTTKEILKSIG